MKRRIYFAFHYKDVANFRANVVRNCWVTQNASGFFDASLWEQAKKLGDVAIQRMINAGLQNTSVTAVLTGSETYSRRWVRYEIIESFKRSNGIINININSILDKNQQTFPDGLNPLNFFYFRLDNNQINLWESLNNEWIYRVSIPKSSVDYNFKGLNEGKFSDIFYSVDWQYNDGYNNFASWIETIAKEAGR